MVGDYIVWVLLIQFPFLQIVAILASQVAQRAGGLKHHIHRAAERVVYFHEYGIVEIMGYANIAFFSRLCAFTMDKKRGSACHHSQSASESVCFAYYIHFLMIKLQSAINQMSCHGRNIHGSNADMDYVLAAKAANCICAVIR